jgi:tRNA(Arg) A34 adenosine deaminase TadA
VKKALLKQMLRQCRLEVDNHPQKDFFPHWTFLVVDNKIISVGMNRELEPPKSFGYHKPELVELGFKPKWHAELDAIKRARTNLTGCVAVNVRLNKQGEVRLSMPCKACRSLLNVVNCSRVYFTTEFGWGSYAY